MTGVGGLVFPGGAKLVVGTGTLRTSPWFVTRILGRSGWIGGGDGDEETEIGGEEAVRSIVKGSAGSGEGALLGPSDGATGVGLVE